MIFLSLGSDGENLGESFARGNGKYLKYLADMHFPVI